MYIPSCTSIPSDFNKSRSLWISSLSSRISLALASSLTIALHTICLARSAYLYNLKKKNEIIYKCKIPYISIILIFSQFITLM